MKFEQVKDRGIALRKAIEEFIEMLHFQPHLLTWSAFPQDRISKNVCNIDGRLDMHWDLVLSEQHLQFSDEGASGKTDLISMQQA